jgi:cytochrome b subunit of formate dehydrogenase
MAKKTSSHPPKPTKEKSTAVVKATASSRRPRYYQRFHWATRIAHGLLLSSFTLLGITGLPQKYALAGWAQALIRFFGGIETTRLIHHGAAVVLMLLTIYHLLDAGYKIFVRRVRLSMLPGIKDVKDGIQAFAYNLGLKKTRPQMDRYTFEEKLEYWALVWGTVIMGITGFLMWNPIASTRLLPGEVIPAAKAAHGGEALLAVAAIIIWHMYSVHLKRFNKSMFTGRMTEAEMLHEHPLELADLKAGLAVPAVDPAALRKRRAVYYPVAGLLAAAMLFGVYGFVAGEQTAITTIPPIRNEVPIYVPYTPTPVPAPSEVVGQLTWDGYVGPILQQKCSVCHSAGSTSGLVLTSYAEAMRGGNSGAVILAGNSAGSKLVILQASGSHYAVLNPDELARIQEWINAGAPEK